MGASHNGKENCEMGGLKSHPKRKLLEAGNQFEIE